MAELILQFPSPDAPGWVRFTREIDGVRRDLTAMGKQMQTRQWKATQQNIDRIIEIILLFVPPSEDKAAARETVLDFTFSELNSAIVRLGHLLAEGRAMLDRHIEEQQEQADTFSQE